MAIMWSSSGEGRAVEKGVGWPTLCQLVLLVECVDLIPVVQHLFFLVWEFGVFRN